MAKLGNYISAKEASVFWRLSYKQTCRKLRVLASALGKKRPHKRYGIVPDIKRVSYQEFADAHNVTLQELERIIK